MENTSKIVEKIKTRLHDAGDLKERTITLGDKPISILYLADLTDTQLLEESVIQPITKSVAPNGEYTIESVQTILSNCEVVINDTIKEAIDKLLLGSALIILDGEDKILSTDVEKITVRAIAEPPTSVVIKGPREGFNESIKYNLSLIRRRCKSEDFVVTTLDIGRLTKTKVAIVYFNSVADKRVVRSITKRLKSIKIDGILDSHYLVSYLEKNPHSLFKQIGDTEKPDVLVGKMLEGRVGILVDGSPIALTLPFILLEDLQNSDDYYSQPIRVTVIRVLRLVGVVLAVLLPGVYVALEKFHYKILPLEFLITILNTTQGIPFSPFAEVVFVILLFEILYEANLRMPQYFGMAMSVVGALILGETAVSAGLVSPPAVMIVALSGITFYIIPSQAAQFSILRLLGVLIGGAMGIYGIIVFCVFIISYLSSFDSYFSAYLAPTSPYIKADQKDLFVRARISEMKSRPESIANNQNNRDREGNNEDQL